MKTTMKNFGAIVLFAAFGFNATTTWANDGKRDIPSIELKYIGDVKNQPLFQLDLNSVAEENFAISIKDQYGNTLYSETVKTKNFSRRFLVDTDEVGEGTLKVEVRSHNNKPEVFTIDRNTRFVAETNVSKL